eukprot:TRINITY_DN13243_c0_g1_i4.p1 TRINITY_DN13243_c0_g1~~TRINITY_DN13243_c0_g1_i4.p1  ORF type:complete len:713 (+),score=153.36 TRINITY_DN13243_c0_g1_i4:756-2894(+)
MSARALPGMLAQGGSVRMLLGQQPPPPNDDAAVPPPPMPFTMMRQFSTKLMRRASLSGAGGGGAPKPPPVPKTCMVCCETFTSDLPHFSCEKDPEQHCLCITCFANYLAHCCESWATLSTIPVKCQIPECGYLIPDALLHTLLTDPVIAERGLWDRYTQSQLKNALSSAEHKDTEVLVTCAFCGKYSEIYEKASPDSWKQSNEERLKAKVAKEQALYEAASRLKNEVEQKVELEIQGEINDPADAVGHLKDLFTKGKAKVNQYRIMSGRSEWEEDAQVPLNPDANFSEEDFIGLIDSGDALLDSDKDEKLEQQLILLNNKIKKEENLKRDVIKKQALEHIAIDIESKVVSDLKVEGAETTQYFVCRNILCEGAYCLGCESFLKKPELGTHHCSVDPVAKLYGRVLETLAAASSRSCPNCGSSGMKDLACTHITCDKCSQRFCYSCGISESKLEGGFQAHNQWTMDLSEDMKQKRCPLYLQAKWGFDGEDAAAALDNFHRSLQIQAIENLKKEVNDETLWNQMVEERFFGKPIVEPPVLFDPENLPPEQRERLRRRERAERIVALTVVLYLVYLLLYVLFFLAMYCWMIHEGRTNLTSYCSQSNLAKFALVHGCLGWGCTFFYLLSSCCGETGLGQCTSCCPQCIGLGMLGTFIWGAVMFYKTSAATCSSSLWTCLNVYFYGVWIGSGVGLVFFLVVIFMAWYYGRDLQVAQV